MNPLINDKVQELYNTTPEEVRVGFGRKTTSGTFTGELGFVFMVPQKLPLDQIPENEILPTTVDVDGTTYKTDVIEVGEIKPLACSAYTTNNCYGWKTSDGYGNITPVTNNQLTGRPIKGGMEISSASKNYGYGVAVGTLGFIAVDSSTQALVGVTNNHVVIGNGFFTSDRAVIGAVIQNESNDDVFQNGTSQSSNTDIGKVIRYTPFNKWTGGQSDVYGQVDGALIALYSSEVSTNSSYLQFGLESTITSPMPFATTSEINNALVGNYPLASSGRSTGAKIGSPCGLVMYALDVMTPVGPYDENGNGTIAGFNRIMMFTRENVDCNYPIYGGDSGSALLAYISGTWKIIGLVFAGTEFYGYACRIDEVASQLGIEAWDGSTKPFIDVDSKQIRAINGVSRNIHLDCNGTTYWQIGSSDSINYCQ